MEILSMLPQGLVLGLSLLSGVTGFLNQIPRPSIPKKIIQRPTRGPNAHRGHHTREFEQRQQRQHNRSNPHERTLNLHAEYHDVDYNSE